MSAEKSRDKKAVQSKAQGIDLPKGEEAVSDIPDGVSEDVYRFWKENGTRIIVYCSVALIAFFSIQGFKQYRVSHEESLRKDFAALDSTESKLEFARKHKKHGLAAFAYLQAGKDSFENGSFDQAAEYYKNAAAALEGSELLPVALLGEASSEKEAGDTVAAASLLEQIGTNEAFAEGIRAEAMFKRIVIALEKGENEVVDSYTAQLEAIDNTQIWVQRLDGIKYYQ